MKIYIVDLEEVETRYTKQWKKYLPIQLKRHTNTEVQVISGGSHSEEYHSRCFFKLWIHQHIQESTIGADR